MIAEWERLREGGAVTCESLPLLERLAEQLRAMGDATRLRLLHLMGREEVCVGALHQAVGGTQANVSKHLGVLRQAGLVTCRREGVVAYYRVCDPSVFQVCTCICSSMRRELCPEALEEAAVVSLSSDSPGTDGAERH